jgi:hypothetical protein
MLFADANNSKIYLQGSTNQFDTTDFRSWVSRENMSLGTSLTKQISKVVPIMSGTGPVNFYVGHKFIPADATTWKGPYVFTPGTHSEIKVRTTGNYVGIKIETEDTNTWKLDNLEVHWKTVGNRGKSV